MLKCSIMVDSVHSHDLGTCTIGVLEITFLENRFPILARMARVTRTHPLNQVLATLICTEADVKSYLFL